MRSWEKKDIIDILIRHHAQLREASVKLIDGKGAIRGHLGVTEGEKLDDDCIVIENYLEETWDIEWDGLKFNVCEWRKPKSPIS